MRKKIVIILLICVAIFAVGCESRSNTLEFPEITRHKAVERISGSTRTAAHRDAQKALAVYTLATVRFGLSIPDRSVFAVVRDGALCTFEYNDNTLSSECIFDVSHVYSISDINEISDMLSYMYTSTEFISTICCGQSPVGYDFPSNVVLFIAGA